MNMIGFTRNTVWKAASLVLALSAMLAVFAVTEGAEFGYHQEAVNYDGFELLRRIGNNGVPDDVPTDFDCEARYLAYNYSLSLQPHRAPMKNVWDALQLTTLCHKPFNPNPDISVQQQRRTDQQHQKKKRLSPPLSDKLSQVQYRVYVDAKVGDDFSTDASDARTPFRTLHRALAHTRAYRRQQLDKNPGSRAADISVGIVLRSGIHYLNTTVEVNVQDSGTIIESAPGETAVLSGGLPLAPQWKPYNVSQSPATMVIQQGADNVWGHVPGPGKSTPTIKYVGTFASSEECQAQCKYGTCFAWTWHKKDATGWSQGCYLHSDHWWSPHVSTTDTSGYWAQAPNIYVADVTEQAPENLQLGMFVAETREDAEAGNFFRANRARYPNIVSAERTLFPAGWVPGGADWDGPADLGNSTFITVGTPTYEANPDFEHFQIGVDGPCSIFTPPESYWCSEKPSGGGAFTFLSPSGVTFNKTVLTRAATYNAELFQETAVLHTWRPSHWSSWMFEFKDFDPESGKGKFSRGGFQGARGSAKGSEWWLANVFEELDHPNEYFYNPDTGKLYYFHNGTGAPPEDFQFVAANLKTLISITAAMDNPVFNFTLRNVVLTTAAYTYMDPHGVPSGGDWGLQRSGAVFAEGTKLLTIENCVFKNLDGNGLFLSGFVHDSMISNNEFTLIGDTAMAAWGYTNLIDGTSGEQPRRNRIEQNFIHEIGLYEKQSSCWFQAKSAQTTLRTNICFNGPRAGVNINDGFGGGNEMEDNVLFNMCRESSDHGPFNSWDRQPFLTDVADPENPSLYPAVNNIHHNFLIGNYGSSMCLDNDDGSAYYHHSDNYLVYGGHKSNYGGHNKVSTNNYNLYPVVYSYSCFSIFQNTLNATYAEAYMNCTCVLRGVANENMYRFQPACDLTKPDTLSFLTGDNTIYTPTANATVNACGKTLTAEQWLQLGLDKGTVLKTSPDVDTIIGWGRKLFNLK
ncbi:uncharacterized protein LOC135811743 [Sycon ciliatum]|uniref:uncharacterized protein LOC135811743 n=1 Tax=Sycon ciliatum TaxID=27933 RepID=UPI0031F6B69C